MSTSAILLRTHRMNSEIYKVVRNIKEMTGYPVFVFADKSSGIMETDIGKTFNLSPDLYKSLGLYTNFDVMWRCGDYVFCAALEFGLNFDYYWMIEPDLHFNSEDPRQLFNHIDTVSVSDFVGVGLSPASETWVWTDLMKIYQPNVYASAFPLTRLSRAAVEVVFSQRRLISTNGLRIDEIGSNEEKISFGNAWPNDESFTPSVIVNAGLDVANINQYGRYVGPGWFTSPLGPHSRKLINQRGNDGFIYHPVFDGVDYETAIRKLILRKKRNNLSDLEIIAGTSQNIKDGLFLETGLTLEQII